MARSSRAVIATSHLAANIDNPSDFRRTANRYLPTKQSIEFVNLLAHRSLQGGGAHSLQGAYGIGKSSLGIFTLNVLASPNKLFAPTKRLAAGNNFHPSVIQVRKSGGMLAIPVIGSASPLSQRIIAGIQSATENHIGKRPKALLRLDKLKLREASIDLLQEGMVDLLNDKNVNSAGVLLIIDEFGRQFEHMIATGLLDDLHLLQNLAELPGKGIVPFNIAIIQHHGLEHYTSRFMSQQHAEWEKVRGRFNEYLLNNTESDTANIVSILMQPVLSKKTHKDVAGKKRIEIGKHVEPLDKKFLTAAKKCLPLHPMTVFILSRLAGLLGQGNRTVVGWLTSHLDTGYQAALIRSNGLIYPEALFRHFFGDIQSMPTNPAIAKRFNAVHSAYSRHGADDHKLEMRLLKTIGLLYFCQGTGLKADLETVKFSMPEISNINNVIKRLASKSLITYRRHSNDYRVWEGSDYDIQTKLNEIMQDKGFSPAAAIAEFAPMRILAHKHFIETGNHRIAEVGWLDKEELAPATGNDSEPKVYIWLDKPPRLKKDRPKTCVWGVMGTINFIDQLQETDALNQLITKDLDLQQDKVASGEVEERLSHMKTIISNKLSAALNTQIKWCLGKEEHNNLQQATSQMMYQHYRKSFVLHNEMVNRVQTSGQATLATRLLIEAMVKNSTEERFGISKFPAERLLYECFFRTTNIHQEGTSNWQLSPDGLIKSELRVAFKLIAGMGKASSYKPCSIDSIVAKFSLPPYGAKPLPVLILCCIYIYVNRDYVELYEDGNLQPTWSYQTLTRLVKSPDSFSINVPESINYPEKALSDFRQMLNENAKKTGKNTPINIARDILIWFSALPLYAQNTSSVSKEASAIRRSILGARSPDDLLFISFPKTLGLKSFPQKENELKNFLKKLKAVFTELEEAQTALILTFESILLRQFSARDLKTAQNKLVEKAGLIYSVSRMHFSNKDFLQIILNDAHDSPAVWFKDLLDKGLGISKPFESWSDDDVAKAEFAFRASLMWIHKASEILATSSAVGKEGRISGNTSSTKLPVAREREISAINKQLNKLPQEQVVPALLELLRLHSGAEK